MNIIDNKLLHDIKGGFISPISLISDLVRFVRIKINMKILFK